MQGTVVALLCQRLIHAGRFDRRVRQLAVDIVDERGGLCQLTVFLRDVKIGRNACDIANGFDGVERCGLFGLGESARSIRRRGLRYSEICCLMGLAGGLAVRVEIDIAGRMRLHELDDLFLARCVDVN